MDLKLHIKLMLLTKQLHDSRSGGRELLCKLNHDALKEIYGENFILCELKPSLLKGMKSIFDAFRGHIDGLNDGVMEEALQKIHTDNVSKVFVDGSNLGEFAKVVKRRFPQVQVSTFFHNVEARFFLGSLRQAKSPRALAVLMVNYLAERKAVRYSDKIICMSERDSRLLERLYGSAATHVSPMALEDKLPINNELTATPQKENFALFVGGVFYANRAGITWFVKHVVPNIQIKICIVGRGFEDLKHELESEGKVVVVGAVDSLADWYRNALFVIAPIFDGSGMKTKVAEALMFGKRIVGTPEAFSGYEDIIDQVGWRCTTADEFVDAISRAQREIEFGFDPQLRALYEKRYSLPAARDRLAKILSSSSTDS